MVRVTQSMYVLCNVCYAMCAVQYVLRNVLVLLYIIIELFGIQSHGFLSVVLVLFSFSCCCRGFTACATGYVYYIMFFL